jgi:hypothetical protein
MSATPDMLAIFYEPTPPSEIRQRQGPNGRMLDYIDARYVMDTLDKLGPENWQDRYEDRADGSVRCGIGINVDGEWIWKWDCRHTVRHRAREGQSLRSLQARRGQVGHRTRPLRAHHTSSWRLLHAAGLPVAPAGVSPCAGRGV